MPHHQAAVRGSRLAFSALMIAVSLLGACGDDDSDDASSTSASTTNSTTVTDPITTTSSVAESTTTLAVAATTSTATPTVPAGARYVALGSSFAAGQGIPEQGPTCGRSTNNYPTLVAEALELELVDVSCGAATLGNLLDEPQGDAAPQVESVTPDTELVTITAGGNDASYSLTTLLCGTQPDPCLATVDTATIDAALVDLPNRFQALAAAIRDRAPDATIFLVTYPDVVPEEGAECAALGLDADEAAYIDDLGDRLDEAFRAAAAAGDLVLIDVYDESAGHGPCAADTDRWVSGVDGGTESFAYHPTRVGHRGVADLIVAEITG